MKPDSTKVRRRKGSLAGAGERHGYEKTAFGWRRVSRYPKSFAKVFWLVGLAAMFVVRRFRRAPVG